MTYEKHDIDAPVNYVKGLLAELHIEDTLLEVVDQEVKNTRFTAGSLRREWINDVLSRPSSDDVRRAALEKPEAQFYRYAERRAADPLAPAPRLVRKLVDEFGVEVVAPIREHSWFRQLDWARRLQLHPDDEIAILAKFFIREVTGEACDAAFEGVVRYQREHCDPAEYESMIRHDNTSEDITKLPIDDMDTFPTCIHYMRAKRSEKMATMTDDMRRKVAQGIRKQCRVEAQADRIAAQKERFQKRPVYFSTHVAVEAVIAGLSSDDVMAVNQDFFASLDADGPTDADTGSAETRFLALMNKYVREERTAPKINQKEADARKQTIGSIGPRWKKKLSMVHADVGGMDQSLWNRWQRDIHHGERRPPMDWSFDYYLFLIEAARG